MKWRKSITAIVLLVLAIAPYSSHAASTGFSVSGEAGTDYTYENGVLTITSSDKTHTVSMNTPGESTSHSIVIDTGGEVTVNLEGLNISAEGTAITVADGTEARINVCDDSDGNSNEITSLNASAVEVGDNASLEIGNLDKSGDAVSIAYESGDAVSIGNNSTLTICDGIVDIAGQNCFAQGASSGLFIAPVNGYDIQLKCGSEIKTITEREDISGISCSTFNSSATYTLSIPVTIEVEKKGSANPPAESFVIDVADETDGEYNGQLEYDLYAEDEDCGITGDWYDTDGEGEYTDTLKLKMREGSEDNYKDPSYIVLSIINDKSENWVYDETKWYVTIEDGVASYHKGWFNKFLPNNGISFTNTYSADGGEIIEEPEEPPKEPAEEVPDENTFEDSVFELGSGDGVEYGKDFTYKDNTLTITNPVKTYDLSMKRTSSTDEKIVIDTGSNKVKINLAGLNMKSDNPVSIAKNANVEFNIIDDKKGDSNRITSNGAGGAISVGDNATLTIRSLNSSGHSLWITHENGDGITLGDNAKLVIRDGVVDISAARAFLFGNGASVSVDPVKGYDARIKYGSVDNPQRKVIDKNEDITGLVRETTQFRSTATYTIEIPVSLTVEGAKPLAQVFTVQVSDDINGMLAGQIEQDVYPVDGISGTGIETDGAGEYQGTVKLAMKQGTEHKYSDNTRIMLALADNGSDSWIIDENKWLIGATYTDGNLELDYHRTGLLRFIGRDGVSFVNTYTAEEAEKPSEDTEEDTKEPDKESDSFVITSDAKAGEDYTYDEGVLTIKNPKKAYDISGTTADRIVVDSDKEVEINLNGVNIQSDSSPVTLTKGSRARFNIGAAGTITSLNPQSGAVTLEEGAELMVSGKSGNLLSISNNSGPAVGLGDNSSLVIQNGSVEISSPVKAFSFGDNSSLFVDPLNGYETQLQYGGMSVKEAAPAFSRKTISENEDVSELARDATVFNCTTTYPIVIPITVNVESDKPVDKVFNVTLGEEKDGKKHDGISAVLYNADASGGITGTSIETSGSGTYEQTLVINLLGGEEEKYTEGTAITVSMADDKDGWVYDDTTWYIESGYTMDGDITHVIKEPGFNLFKNEGITFTNYIGANPDSDTDAFLGSFIIDDGYIMKIDPSNPETGDRIMPVYFAIAGAAALLVIVILLITRRRKNGS